MARKPNQVSETAIRLLKQTVKRKSALPCNSFSDMQLLQVKIRTSTDETLSIQTLNRFFGLIKSNFKPSVATLDILSNYVNCGSFSQFEIFNNGTPADKDNVLASFEVIKVLFSEEKPGCICNRKGPLMIVKNLHRVMEVQPELVKDIHVFMASHDFGRKFFYEKFINIDALNHGYGSGLRYYLMHISDREQMLFAYSILCLRYFLNCQHDKFKACYEKINNYTFSEIKGFRPSIIGQYYAARIFNCVINDRNPDIVDEVFTMLSAISHDEKENCCASFPEAEYALGQALILANEFDLAWKVLHQSQERLRELPCNMGNVHSIQFKLLYICAGFYSGNYNGKKANELLRPLLLQPVCILSKKFYALIMNDLYNAVLPASQSNSLNTVFDALISETGFVYFRDRLEYEDESAVRLMDINGKKIM